MHFSALRESRNNSPLPILYFLGWIWGIWNLINISLPLHAQLNLDNSCKHSPCLPVSTPIHHVQCLLNFHSWTINQVMPFFRLKSLMDGSPLHREGSANILQASVRLSSFVSFTYCSRYRLLSNKSPQNSCLKQRLSLH